VGVSQFAGLQHKCLALRVDMPVRSYCARITVKQKMVLRLTESCMYVPAQTAAATLVTHLPEALWKC